MVNQAFQAVEGWPLDAALRLLQECLRKTELAASRHVYALIVSNGLNHVSIITNHLIRLFAECGSLPEANAIFCKVAKRSVYTWHAIIAGHTMLGEPEKALQLYDSMQHTGLKPDKVIFLCTIKTCANLQDIGKGRLIHDQIMRTQFELDVAVGTSLVDMYAKCGCLEEARKVFEQSQNRDVVMWGAMITGYGQHGHGLLVLKLLEKMLQEGIKLDRVTFSGTLKACGSVNAVVQGHLLHDQIFKIGHEADMVVASSLVDMYAKCGSLKEAHKVFSKLPCRDVVSWSAMIGGYADHDEGFLALEFFEKMLQEGLRPDVVVFLSVLKACGSVRAVNLGRLVHDQIIRSGLDSEVEIANTLIGTYAKCGSLEQASKVFKNLKRRSLVSWDVMIAGYAQHGQGYDSLELFEKMQQEGLMPAISTYSWILKTCSDAGFVELGKELHRLIINFGLESDLMIGNALVDMYGKCGHLEDACQVFDGLLNPDIVSWSVLIAGYTQAGLGVCALDCFEKMQEDGLKGDKYTYSCLLKACGIIGDIDWGRLIHEQIIQSGIDIDSVVQGALVDMYVKCRGLDDAGKVFNECFNCDLVSWNTMMAGYLQHEQSLLALDLYNQMQRQDVVPDDATFLCVLKACGATGAIDQGKLTHDEIIRSDHGTDLVICNTLIDMYSKCARLDEARKVFDGLLNRNVVSWNAIIAGYSQHGLSGQALQCFEDMQQQGWKPNARTYTSVLGACSNACKVKEAFQYFVSMRDRHGITPTIEHFDCMVDLLGRAGRVEEAEELLQTMPHLPDNCGWMSLLSACKVYDNMELGRWCFEQIAKADPTSASSYMLMSNIYANAHRWDNIHKVQEARNCAAAWKKPGVAWIDVNNRLQEFTVGERAWNIDKTKLNRLTRLVKDWGYVPELRLVLESIINEDEEFLCGHGGKSPVGYGNITISPQGTSHLVSNLELCTDGHLLSNLISKASSHESNARNVNQFAYLNVGGVANTFSLEIRCWGLKPCPLLGSVVR